MRYFRVPWTKQGVFDVCTIEWCYSNFAMIDSFAMVTR